MKKKLLLTAVVLGFCIVAEAREGWEIRTPKAPETPRINGSIVFGVRPGNPILYQVPVTGKRPIVYGVKGLPDGVTFDAKTGRLGGKIANPGDYKISFTAQNELGAVERAFTIKVGEDICLTPPMGWNSWYCFSEAVSDTGIRTVARGMRERGLVDYGWSYVNIDDCWQSNARGGEFNAIIPNARFPDMKALADYVHDQGLKLGIYSTPWISTYAGFIGGSDLNGDEKKIWLPDSQRIQPDQVYGRWPGLNKLKVGRIGTRWMFDNDVKQWAAWGIDYVKVDWLPNDVPTTEKMFKPLRECGRDIVYSLSNEAPFQNAAGLSKLAQLWRTSGDIHDRWGSISNIAFNRNAQWRAYQKPGHFNDPDMLQVGDIGTPNNFNTKYRKSNLTAAEQYTQVSLWSIMASPLLLSCDIAGMDDFTFGLLANSEVLAVNQDPLCIQGENIYNKDDVRVLVKPLHDGSLAVCVVNTKNEKRALKLTAEMIGKDGDFAVRDLWYQKDLGKLSDGISKDYAAHDSHLFLLKKTQ